MTKSNVLHAITCMLCATFLAGCSSNKTVKEPKIPNYEDIMRTDVHNVRGKFSGWPANNGIWHYPENDKIVVGYSSANYDANSPGHKIVPPDWDYLAESFDGGKTWKSYLPENYADNCKNELTRLSEPIDFTAPGFTIRVKYGTEPPGGKFFYSKDQGVSWEGPFAMLDVSEHEEMDGRVLTPRTDYIVLGKHHCVFMVSAKPSKDVPDEFMSDRAMCIETRDGGQTFQILSWIVPPSDPFRAVMPSSVKISDTHFVTALRRKTLDTERCWIDTYETKDAGKTWKFLSRVAETGIWNNGNPPAMTKLKDGSLCVVYGNRDQIVISGRYSADNGKTWEKEFTIRRNFNDYPDKDIGYPRITCLNDGTIVVIYYWVSSQNTEQFIEAAIWKP